MRIFRERGYAVLPVLMTALATGTLAVVVPIAATAHQQPTGTAISVATDVNTKTEVQAPLAVPAEIPAPVQAPTNMDVFAQESTTVAESVEAANAVPAAFTTSAKQRVALASGGSPMYADMTARKADGKIFLDISYYSGVQPLNPEIFFKVTKVTCSDGSAKNTADLSYGQWNGHTATTVIYAEGLPCEPVGFTLSQSPAGTTSGPFWTMNADANFAFTS
jgi:hypothetical protein